MENGLASHRRRHVEPRLSGHADLPISHRHRGHRCARASPTAMWASNGDPCRPGQPVYLEGARPLGYAYGVTLDFSRPGKPSDNAYAESFNATVRLECLGRHWFLDLDDVREKVEEWRIEYNPALQHPSVYALEENRFC